MSENAPEINACDATIAASVDDQQRPKQGAGRELIKRIGRGGRIAQNDRALTEVVQQQRRENDGEPGDADRSFAEVSHVGVQRLGTSDDEDHSAEDQGAGPTMRLEKLHRVPRVNSGENPGFEGDLARAERSDREEPDGHERTERSADARGSEALYRKDADQNHRGHHPDHLADSGRDDLEAVHRAEDRDGRSDHAVAVQQRRAEQSDEDENLSAFLVGRAPLLLQHEGEERHHTAFPAVVRPHDECDVLDGDDNDQRPDDHRENAVDVRRVRSEAVLFAERLLHRV